MAAEERDTTTEEQQPVEPWSIMAAAGGDPAEADRIAAALVYKYGLLDKQQETMQTAADRTIDQIRRVTGANVEQIERQKARLAFYLQEYQAVNPPASGKTRHYMTGDTALRHVPAGISVNKDAVLALAKDDESLYLDGTVKLVPTVDTKAAKKRFSIDDSGTIVDTKTGEIVGNNVFDGPVEPLTINTPAHEAFSVKPISGVKWLPGMLPDVEPPEPPEPADEAEALLDEQSAYRSAVGPSPNDYYPDDFLAAEGGE